MAFDNKERCKRYAMKKKLIEEGNKLFREWELYGEGKIVSNDFSG